MSLRIYNLSKIRSGQLSVIVDNDGTHLVVKMYEKTKRGTMSKSLSSFVTVIVKLRNLEQVIVVVLLIENEKS
jgi:hypothetical protein